MTDFSITIRPLRAGFSRDGHLHRLWIGETSLGQNITLISVAMQTFGHYRIEGFDYTPIEDRHIRPLPASNVDRLEAVKALLAEIEP